MIRGKYNILILISLINGKFRRLKLEKWNKLINYIITLWLELKNWIAFLGKATSLFSTNS